MHRWLIATWATAGCRRQPLNFPEHKHRHAEARPDIAARATAGREVHVPLQAGESVVVAKKTSGVDALTRLPFLASLQQLLAVWPHPVQAHLPTIADEASAIDVAPVDAHKLFENGMGLRDDVQPTSTSRISETPSAPSASDIAVPLRAPDVIRLIHAVFDDSTIRVYQAYSREIADAALAAQRFVPPFSLNRMTWIKPSFRWMTYRCGYAQKDAGQARVLAVDIRRVVQWDPDRDLRHGRLDRRAIQIGLEGAAIVDYATRWIVRIETLRPSRCSSAPPSPPDPTTPRGARCQLSGSIQRRRPPYCAWE